MPDKSPYKDHSLSTSHMPQGSLATISDAEGAGGVGAHGLQYGSLMAAFS